MSVTEFAGIVLAQVLGMTVGFMLGVLLRSSAAAIVAYFVYSLVLPGLLMLLAGLQSWFADIQPWVDFNIASARLYERDDDGGVLGAARHQRPHLARRAAGRRASPW